MSRITNWFMEDNAVVAVSGRENLVQNAEVKGLGMQPSAFLFIIYISLLPKSCENVPFLC